MAPEEGGGNEPRSDSLGADQAKPTRFCCMTSDDLCAFRVLLELTGRNHGLLARLI